MQLVYFSPLPWASFKQRPHKFVEWFHARHGGKVLWIEPYPTRLPVLADWQRLKRCSARPLPALPTLLPDWLTLLSPRAWPIEPLPGVAAVNDLFFREVLQQVARFVADSASMLVVGKPSALALKVLQQNSDLFSVFDAMDDFPAFYHGLSHYSMARQEARLAACCSRIMASSTELMARFGQWSSKLTCVPNACDGESMPAMRGGACPPVLGYVGTLGAWFDWGMIDQLAQARPDLQLRLIGPLHGRPPALPGNVEFLPACDQPTALEHMRGFSVGLIPFVCNRLTQSVDPIKYYEYRALGVPVLSSCFGEMARRKNVKGVFLMEERENVTQLIDQALAHQDEAEMVCRFRKENSWDVRFDASGICSRM